MEVTSSMQEGVMPFARQDRVRAHTSLLVNDRIDRLARQRVEEAKEAGPLEIRARLEALDREWDIDRALMLNFAVVGGAVFATGLSRISVKKRMNGWLYFFAVQLSFLAYHAVAGWCPPVSVMRRLGFRTHREIEVERRALESALAGAVKA